MKPKKPTMKQVAAEFVRLDFLVNKLLVKVAELEAMAHTPRDFVCCKDCGCKLKKDE